ncbi:MAG: hypothetical protein L6422_05785 [Candidatus Marinimicrobia bacterium]|nr:hypothetical protein [Candidatus Neomarinimicrobiota bacterium]
MINQKYPVVATILRYWILNLIILVSAGISIIFVVFFVIEKEYTANVSILPSAANFATGVNGKISALAGMAGLDLPMASGQSQEMYMGIIVSRRLLRELLYSRFTVNDLEGTKEGRLIDLVDVEGKNESEIFGKALKKMREEVISIGLDPDNNILNLSITLKNPELSAAVANQMVEILDKIVQNQVQKEYYEQYEYLKKRIQEIQDSIKVAEVNLEVFLEKITNIIAPKNQIEELRLRRNMEIQTTIFTELTKQKEMFILQNMINLSHIKILDHAIPPYRKSRPKRIMMTISLGFLWFCFQVGVNASSVIGKRIKADLTSTAS